jgi:hypothetical protein
MRRRTLLGMTSLGFTLLLTKGARAEGIGDRPDDRVEVRLDLPREVLEAERTVAGSNYSLGESAPLPPDPNAMEASFVDPVTLIAVVTLSILAERILNFALSKHGQGVMVDARDRPPRVSILAGIPHGFVLLIHPDGKTETVRHDASPNVLANLLGTAMKLGKQ